MNWFKKLLWQWTRQGREIEQDESDSVLCSSSSTLRESSLRGSGANGLNFTLYTASGGHVLESRHYDEKKDENFTKLYIINDEDDFAKQIAQCITLETLRR